MDNVRYDKEQKLRASGGNHTSQLHDVILEHFDGQTVQLFGVFFHEQ